MSSSISVSGHEMKTSELNSLVAISSGTGPLSRINYDVKRRSGANAMSSGFCLTEFHLGMKLWEIGTGGPMETLGREIRGCLSKFSDESLGRHLPLVRWEDQLLPVAATDERSGRPPDWHRHSENEARPERGEAMPRGICMNSSGSQPPEKRLETGRLYLVQTPPNLEPVIRRTSDGCLNSTLCFSLRL